MKRNAIVRIILFSLLLLVLVSILFTGLAAHLFTFRTSTSFSDETVMQTSRDLPASMDPNGIRGIEIDWASGNVTITTGDVENIEFYEVASGKNPRKMVYKIEEGTLSIEFCREHTVNFGSIGDKDLFITVPRSWSGGTLEVDAASADVTVQQLTADTFELDLASGNCTFEDCTVNLLDVDTASGNLYYTGNLNRMEYDAASGDLTAVFYSTPSSLKLEAASGDFDLTLPEGSGFTAKMNEISGMFSSEFECSKVNNDFICGDGSCRIDINSISGNTIIRKPAA